MRLPESRRGKRLSIALVAVAVIGVYYAISRLIPHDDLQQLLEDVSNTLGAWTYLLVGTSPSSRRAPSSAWSCRGRR